MKCVSWLGKPAGGGASVIPVSRKFVRRSRRLKPGVDWAERAAGSRVANIERTRARHRFMELSFLRIDWPEIKAAHTEGQPDPLSGPFIAVETGVGVGGIDFRRARGRRGDEDSGLDCRGIVHEDGARIGRRCAI